MKIHRTPRAVAAALAIGSMLFAACSAEETSASITDASLPDSALVAETDPADTAPSTAAPEATTTTPAPPATTTTAPAPPPTNAPAPPPTNAPLNDPPATDAPVDTEPPAPDFASFAASNVSACAAPDVSVPTVARMVTLTWDVVDAESVYVAVGNVDGIYEGNLPTTGSLELFVNCPDAQTYYVVAENASGRTVQEATR